MQEAYRADARPTASCRRRRSASTCRSGSSSGRCCSARELVIARARRPPRQRLPAAGDRRAAGSPPCTSCPSMLQLFLEDPRAARLHRPARGSSAAARRCPRRSRTAFFERLPSRAAQPVRPHRGGRRRDLLGVRPERATCAFVPIGKPIANTQIYILDAALQPCAGRGAPASCTSAASGSARGYLNRPELTAERFVAGPVRADAGRAAVPDRRPGPVPARRQHRVPGPHRLPGQDPGLPHRARRDRGGPGGDPGHPPGRRRGPRARSSGDLELVAYVLSPDGEGRAEGRGSASSCSPGCPSTWSRRPSSSSTGFRRPRAARSTGRPCPLRAVPPGGRDAVRGPADTARAAHRRCVAAGPGRGVSRRARPVLRARRHLAPGRALRQRDADRAGRDDLRRNPVRRPVDRRVRRLPAGGLPDRRRPAGRARTRSRSRARPVRSPSPRRTSPGFGRRCPCSARTPRTPATGTRRRSSS